MEQQRSFHFQPDPGIRMLRWGFTFDYQAIVHAFDAG
jgi:hypothetical protein